MKLENPIYRKDLGKTEYTNFNPITPDEFLTNKFGAVLNNPVSIDGRNLRFVQGRSIEKDGWYIFSEVNGVIL